MDCEYFIDTTRLSLHTEMVVNEQHTVKKTLDKITYLKNIINNLYGEDTNVNMLFRHLIEDLNSLADYYSAMAKVMNNTCDDAKTVICKIGRMLEDSRFNPESIIH